MLDSNAVLITDEKGIVVEITDHTNAGDDIQQHNGLLCPGFINAHCHLELSHMKGVIPEKTGLVDFVQKIITARHFADEIIFAAIENAENEMLQNGIVAVGDICNNTLTIPQKKKQRLQYHNFIEVSGFTPSVAQLRFDKAKNILAGYNTGQLTSSTLCPHAPYSVSAELFALLNNATAGATITIHNQEAIAEDEFFKKGSGDFLRLYNQLGIDISFHRPSGKSSLQTWLPHFTNQQKIIAVHNVITAAEDIAFSQRITRNAERITCFCLCPNANLYITGLLPNIDLLLTNNCKIVLGTDSLASNHQLSIWEEIKTLQKHFPHLALSNLLMWATLNGAEAVNMQEKLGSFEKGKQPGVLLLNDDVKRLL